MKHLKKWMLIIGLVSLTLSGCGTTDEQTDNINGNAQTDHKDINKEQQENQDTNTEQGSVEEQNSEQKNDNNEAIQSEKTIQYTVNGEETEGTALLQSSDNQHYSMYILPEFELTAEEPNKDVLYLTENDHIFMRIELLSPNVQWETLEENTKSQLQAVNKNVEFIDMSSKDEQIKNTVAMEASNGVDVVTAYLVKDSNQPYKLSIFTKKDLDYKDAFLQMGKTIMKSE